MNPMWEPGGLWARFPHLNCGGIPSSSWVELGGGLGKPQENGVTPSAPGVDRHVPRSNLA